MSLEETTRSNGRPVAEVLAEMTGRPVEDFEYDGETPDASEQDWERVEEADE
jgi:hypothetical protein